MIGSSAEPVQVVKERRDRMLAALVDGVPFIGFLGIRFRWVGDELTAILPYAERHIGNPLPPALHGGVTAAFLEVAAIVQLTWSLLQGENEPSAGAAPEVLRHRPKTIDFSIDYLRPGQPRDAHARARVNRSGRRYASVHVEAWQDDPERLFAQGTGHFLMPRRD